MSSHASFPAAASSHRRVLLHHHHAPRADGTCGASRPLKRLGRRSISTAVGASPGRNHRVLGVGHEEPRWVDSMGGTSAVREHRPLRRRLGFIRRLSATTPASTATASSDGVHDGIHGDTSNDESDGRRSAVVVGAGPAGALAALSLANVGWRVRVFDKEAPAERTEDPGGSRPGGISAGGKRGGRGMGDDRSYNIVLSPRGIGALDAAGVVLPEEQVVRLEGNVRHLEGVGKLSSQFKGTVAVNRGVLADAIVAAAVARHGAGRASGGSVEFARGCALRRVDFESRVAHFASSRADADEDADAKGDAVSSALETMTEASYDLLVAADGVNSAVRGQLVDDGSLTFEQNVDDMLFKTVRLPVQTPSAEEGRDAEAATWRRCFHTWPNGLISMLAPPDPAGTLSAVVILPGGKHAQGGRKTKKKMMWTWDKINTKQDVESLFRECFPDAFKEGAPPEEECERVLRQRARPGGVTTTCSRLTAHDGSVVLIGDAAHSMWPSLGQGANCALETSQYLATALESSPDDQAKAMAYFEEVRLPQVHAAGRLSEAGFGGTAKRAGNFLFFAKIALLMLLNKIAPFLFDRPALTNINNPSWAYDDIEDEVRRENATLACLASAATIAAVGTAVFGAEAFFCTAANVVKAVVLGEEGNEGAAIVALGSAAVVTAIVRRIMARRGKKRNRGNASVRGAVTEA